MSSSVEESMDLLYEMIDTAKSVPFSDDCRLDRDRVLDLMDDIRNRFPKELAEARRLVSGREQYIADTEKKVKEMRKKAEADLEQLLNSNDIVARAKSKAREILIDARKEAAEVVQKSQEQAATLNAAADQYCEDLLRRTDEAIAAAQEEIRRSRAQFQSASGKRRPPAGEADS